MPVALARTPVTHTVELPGGRTLRALAWPGRGLPVVYLHGLMDSADGWAELCAVNPRPCVAIDLPGFGESDLPTHAALSAYAEDVVVAIRRLVRGDFVLIGHSLGGGVATAVAERLRERVRTLVLLAPAGFGRIALAEAISLPGVRDLTEAILPLALRSEAIVRAAYRLMIANGVQPCGEVIERIVARDSRLVAGAREGTKAVVRAGLSKRSFRHRRLPFDQPVVVVWGDRDRLVPLAHLDGVRRAFGDVAEHVWPGMGHHPQRERREQLCELIEATCRAATARPRVARAA